MGKDHFGQLSPDFSLGTAAVSAGVPESELTRHLNEMNFLSAHRSSNPTTPATQSVSAATFPSPLLPVIASDSAASLPCERFTSALAGRRASLGVGVVEPPALRRSTSRILHMVISLEACLLLVGKKPGRSINASRHDATPRRQRLLHHDLHGPVRLEVGHQRSNSAIVVGTNMLIGGLLKVSRLKGASVCAGGSSRFRAVADPAPPR